MSELDPTIAETQAPASTGTPIAAPPAVAPTGASGSGDPSPTAPPPGWAEPPFPPAPTAEPLPGVPGPRIRIGAVLWGLVVMAAGAGILWIATSSARRTAALETVLGFRAFEWTVIAVVLVGGTLTLFALAAVIRRLQARRASRAVHPGGAAA